MSHQVSDIVRRFVERYETRDRRIREIGGFRIRTLPGSEVVEIQIPEGETLDLSDFNVQSIEANNKVYIK